MNWLLRPAPLARIGALRVLAYLFVPVDVLFSTSWVAAHGQVPAVLYQPLMIGRLLSLPTPGRWVLALEWLLVGASLIGAAAAARGRPVRFVGILVAVGYLQWMVVAMSYGKVDHDRFAFLVLLWALPTVPRSPLRDRSSSQAAGWVVQLVSLAVVATYTLSALAKLRFGGLDWVDGATITRAVVRRPTIFSAPLLHVPWTLHAFQYVLVGVELVVAPLLLVHWRRPQVTWALVVGFFGFHLMTFAMLTIIFLPHCVAMLALLPLERVTDLGRRRLVASL